jgi:hypothetical protein
VIASVTLMVNRKPPPKEKAPRKQLGTRIPADLHRRLVHFTVDHDVDIQDAVAEAIEDYLAKKKRGA